MLDEIKDLIAKVTKTLNSKVLPEIVSNTNKCNQCGLKDICQNEQLLKDKLDEIKKVQ